MLFPFNFCVCVRFQFVCVCPIMTCRQNQSATPTLCVLSPVHFPSRSLIERCLRKRGVNLVHHSTALRCLKDSNKQPPPPFPPNALLPTLLSRLSIRPPLVLLPRTLLIPLQVDLFSSISRHPLSPAGGIFPAPQHVHWSGLRWHMHLFVVPKGGERRRRRKKKGMFEETKKLLNRAVQIGNQRLLGWNWVLFVWRDIAVCAFFIYYFIWGSHPSLSQLPQSPNFDCKVCLFYQKQDNAPPFQIVDDVPQGRAKVLLNTV